MKRVGLVVHPTQPVPDAVEAIESWSKDRGLEVVQVPSGDQPHVAPPGEVSACDLVVALGGDGTILKALHASARTRTPVLGVGYGSLGALTSVAADELRTGLDRFAADEWRARELPALVIRAGDDQISRAINDLVLTRGRGTQLLLDVFVRGELYVRLAGDGIVVATPLGSSAYSMAAGGSLIAEGCDAFLCTPVSMHGGCAPPVVIAGSDEVAVDVHPGHSGLYVDIDGFPVATDARRFTVTKENGYAVLIALDEPGTGLSGLRERGLISDSPRLLGRDRFAAGPAYAL
jgi:NAD+ kinase